MNSLVRIAVILVVSAAVGAGYATVKGLPWKPDLHEVAKKVELKAAVNKEHERLRKTVGMTLEEFRTHIAQGGAVIDARPKEEFEKAHLRVDSQPPVLNVEPHEVTQHLTRLGPLMGQPIAIYCTSETCELGEELYLELERNQFFNMRIFFPGWEGIQKAGLPTVGGADAWSGDSLRTGDDAREAPAEEGEKP
jgi:hypothetical protein